MELFQVTLVDSDDNNKEYLINLTAAQVEEISNDETKYMNLLKSLKEKPKEDNKPSTTGEILSKWTSRSIKLLLDQRLGMEEKFTNPTTKKIKLWEIIAKHMAQNGFVVSANDCYSKYRNLLQTYRHNKEKRMKKTGESAITWEYFEIFDEILGCKASSCPPKNLLSSSIEDIPEDADDEDEEAKNKNQRHLEPPQKRKKHELSIVNYLYYKTKRDERRDTEKKNLKLQEIDALNNLADAIRAAVGENSKVKKYGESDSN